MNLGTRLGIDVTEFNIWGINSINNELDQYLNNDNFETSVKYLHIVSTIFGVEALTDPGNVENMHYNWLVGDYSKAIVGHDTADYKRRMWDIFEAYKASLRKLISNHTVIMPNKAYTADFKDGNLLIVREVSMDIVNDNIFEII